MAMSLPTEPRPRVYQIGGFNPVFGRIPEREIVRQFQRRGVGYEIGREKSARWFDERDYTHVYWGWECYDAKRYRTLFESPRRFSIVIFGQEQPQRLDQLRQVARYGDMVITSSPVYRLEFDGFMPFGVHDVWYDTSLDSGAAPRPAILISGSYRHSRGQLFERLLETQPFKWPVYLFPTCLHHDMVEHDRTRELVARFPGFAYPAAESLESYIPRLLQHMREHRIFIDFTANSSNYCKFHEELDVLFTRAHQLTGGYCPERVLDALWMGCECFCFEDRAVRSVLGEQVHYYDSMEALVRGVDACIDRWRDTDTAAARHRLAGLTTSRNFDRFARLYKTGAFSARSW